MPDPSYITFNQIATSIKRMPIRAIRFYLGIENDFDILDIFQIESESSFIITPMKKPTSSGGYITIGFKWEIKLYIPHNIYKNNFLLAYLDDIRRYGVNARLYLGTAAPDTVVAPAAINSDEGLELIIGSNASISYSIESIEFRPRLILTIDNVTKAISGIFH